MSADIAKHLDNTIFFIYIQLYIACSVSLVTKLTAVRLHNIVTQQMVVPRVS